MIIQAPTTAAAADRAPLRCDACGHPLHEHDSIGTRFCEATQSHALTRHCICR